MNFSVFSNLKKKSFHIDLESIFKSIWYKTRPSDLDNHPDSSVPAHQLRMVLSSVWIPHVQNIYDLNELEAWIFVNYRLEGEIFKFDNWVKDKDITLHQSDETKEKFEKDHLLALNKLREKKLLPYELC